ncbi:MAG: ArsB/NhaD family transporter [Candidatus Bathyarchaeia archaeon]
MAINSMMPILAFATTIFLILKQPKLTIHLPLKVSHNNGHQIKIDYGTAPLLGIFILLASSSINTTTIVNGILGTNSVRPYEILILFMALAYICVSLDLTGFFAYIALHIARAAGNSGRKLFFYFFLLSGFLTVFTSNDIVILTLTPIICYFANYAGVDPIPYLVAQFFAANIWSIALFIGNPTNIIVAQAFNLSFLEYSRWMIAPTLSAGLSCLALLWMTFKKRIPSKIDKPDVDPRNALVDKQGCIFGLSSLAACLLLLGCSSELKIPVWIIPLFFATLMFGRSVLLEYILPWKKTEGKVQNRTLALVAKRMPWKIVPFVVSLFIMVEALYSTGWIDIFASSLSAMLNDVVLAVFATGFLSSLTSNIMNNQPMTILFVRILQNTHFAANPLSQKGAMLALVLGSNFGANFTPLGALAGIMWAEILHNKGIRISFKEFSKYGFTIMPTVAALSCLSLLIEILE